MAAKKPRVLILTSLTDFDRAYSIGTVSLDHCRMLHVFGYPYRMAVLENFNQDYKEAIEREGLHIEYALPQTFLHTYKTNEPPKKDGDVKTPEGRPVPGFDAQARTHFEGYDKQIEEFKPDVVITHDLMFQAGHLVQNAAVRMCIEKYPQLRWLHWVHSAPSYAPDDVCHPSTLRFRGAPRSKFVYLNHTDLQNYGNMINEDTSNLAVVHNPRDIRAALGMAPETWVLCDRYKLLEGDVVQTYAVSAARWNAKGVGELIAIFGYFKDHGLKPKLVLCTAHTNTPKVDDKYLREIEGLGAAAGLELDDELIITSRLADEMAAECRQRQDVEEAQRWARWRYSVPQRVVRDLVYLSDIFIFPSLTENCSLILAEAAAAGNLLVLNGNFLPMMEFAPPNTLHYDFTANRVRKIPDRPDCRVAPWYYEAVARELVAEMNRSRLFASRQFARKMFSYDNVFKRMMEPLLWEGFKAVEDKRPLKPQPKKTAPAEVKSSGATSEPGGEKEKAPSLDEKKLVTPDEPYDGMPCTIFGECTAEQRKHCIEQAGKCFLADTFVEERK